MRDSQTEGAIDPSEEPTQLAFELATPTCSSPTRSSLSRESTPIDRARRAVERRLAAAAPGTITNSCRREASAIPRAAPTASAWSSAAIASRVNRVSLWLARLSRSAWSVLRSAGPSGSRNSSSIALTMARKRTSWRLPAGVRVTRWRRRSLGSRRRSISPPSSRVSRRPTSWLRVEPQGVGDRRLRFACAFSDE